MPFKMAVPQIYAALGLSHYLEGDSIHTLNGDYAIGNILGIAIKIEENVYDYEDEYDYSIFIKKDVLSDVSITEENIKLLSHIVVDLLCRNLGIEVAIEIGNKLTIYHPS